MSRLNPILEGLPPYPITELDRIRAEVRASGLKLHDFSLGDPVDPTPGFIKDALRDSVTDVSQYPTVVGARPVREAFCRYFLDRFGVELDPDLHVMPTSGSKEALFHLPMVTLDAAADDRVVLYPDPGYPAYERGALFSGGEPHPVPLEGDFVFRPWTLPDDLLRRTRILIINSPHNPTGAVTSMDDMRRTWELCRKWDILLVSDECYIDIYDEDPPPSMLQVGMEGVIAVYSLSKRSGMTGYRSGFLAGDPAWMKRLRTFRANPGLAPLDFVNEAARVAWLETSHVAARRALFAERRRVLLDFLRGSGFEVLQTHAALYIWFRAPRGYDDMTYAAHLLRAGVVVSPGRLLAQTTAGNGWLRLALVPDLRGTMEAIAAWRTVL